MTSSRRRGGAGEDDRQAGIPVGDGVDQGAVSDRGLLVDTKDAATTGEKACPRCGVDLTQRDENGLPSPYSREIGYSAHDYIQFWICPFCGDTWNRWDESSHRFAFAEQLRADYEARRPQPS